MANIPQWRFKLAVERYQRPVYQLANALLHDRDEAQDVAQEAFTKLWLNSDGIKTPKAWLLRVTRNECLDRLRNRPRLQYDTAITDEHRSIACDSATRIDEDIAAAELHTEIAALPEPQRSLIVLFSLKGMSGRDCAQILDLTTNQVKVYLHRAKSTLRKKLESDNG